MFHRSRSGFARVANIAATSQPKTVCHDVINKCTNTSSQWIRFNLMLFWQGICMATFVSHDVGHFSYLCDKYLQSFYYGKIQKRIFAGRSQG